MSMVHQDRHAMIELYRDEYGFNLIPIRKGDGKKLTITWKPYQTEKYVGEIPNDQDYAVILGESSNNLICFDFDEYDSIDEINEIMGFDVLNETIVEQTGDGFHVLAIADKNLQKQTYVKNGKAIEVLSQGQYFIGATSEHYEKDESGNYFKTGKLYEMISHVRKLKKINTVEQNNLFINNGWSRGTRKVEETNQNEISLNETTQLEKGGWVAGQRYTNGFSLALKYFTRGEKFEFIVEKIKEVNQKCNPPHDDSEIHRIIHDSKTQYLANITNDSGNELLASRVRNLLKNGDISQGKKDFEEFCKGLPRSISETDRNIIWNTAEKNYKKSKNTESESTSVKVYNIGSKIIQDVVRSESDTEQIVVKVSMHNREHWVDIFSPSVEQIIRVESQKEHGDIYGNSTYQNGILNLHANYLLHPDTEMKPVFNRCALSNNEIFYDLQDGDVYCITKDGVFKDTDDKAPIFLKSPSAKTKYSIQQKPMKSNDNAIEEFRKLLRISDDDSIIFKSHLISYFLTGIPIPIVILHGEQGSAKTTTSNGIKALIDPEGENAFSMPKEVDDLAVILSKHYVTSFDNTDNFTKDISQFLCKAVTGTQHPKRKLFTTAEEFSLVLMSKIILNGITPEINQPDLVERSIFYELPRIERTDRQTDESIKKKINQLIPSVLAQVFDTLHNVLSTIDDVKQELEGSDLPRMASFAVWGEAIARDLGATDGEFIKKYHEKMNSSSLSVVEEFPVIEKVMSHLKEEIKDVGKSTCKTATQWYDVLEISSNNDDRLPKDVSALGKQFKQLAPTFRTLDYEVTNEKYNKRDDTFPRGSTIITFTKLGIEKYA